MYLFSLAQNSFVGLQTLQTETFKAVIYLTTFKQTGTRLKQKSTLKKSGKTQGRTGKPKGEGITENKLTNQHKGG